ncbi:MAG: 3-hydroxyacyl-ACP dehydratase FabZ [Planctomycetota bacterium]|jgi:UDP-3-O-[3-hydroxymyristoyl] N-acetylglucosamine deacetylase/3-hydroxyacyl-[acyl-carrier-protein] dehydratase|nr:3-hydroxyacyl-ACP dehydratase FabZ [Planctomycetota bacterium]
MTTRQHTLKAPVSFAGPGLHSGAECSVTVKPGDAGTGLVVSSGGVSARLSPLMSDGSRNCNAVRVGPDLEIMTIEHLLSAIWACGIDNAVLEFAGPEAPGLDGSALRYAEELRAAGIVEQDADRKVFIPKEAVSVGNDKAGVSAFPSPDGKFRVTYVLDYAESPRARGTVTVEIDPDTFLRDIAPARTFVMKQHAEAMLKAGLGRGANPQNTLVLDGDAVVDNEFRVADECVRHKILDLIGDLSILNRRLGVHIVANKSGHALNIELAKALQKQMTKAENPAGVLDFQGVTRILPHRYPFLLVDRVLELEEKKRIVAVKNLTFNEEFFQGHFPGQPIMPGVLQIEALAQAGAIMMLGEYAGKGKLAVLMTADDVKWRKQVIPGDCLYLHAEFVKMKRNVGVVRVRAEVDGEVTTEATIKFAIVDSNPAY